MKIDTTQNQVPIWLVWSWTMQGLHVLHAVCLEHSRAVLYRDALMMEEHIRRLKIWIEPSQANHLFASEFGDIPQELLARRVEAKEKEHDDLSR